MSAEEIVLPRSGVRLTREARIEYGSVEFSDSTGCARIYALVSKWRAYCVDQTEDFGTRDECIAWLDARVLSLRAALLAGTEERIARWIVERNADRYGRSWEDTPDCQRDDARSAATDLISALTGGSDDPA